MREIRKTPTKMRTYLLLLTAAWTIASCSADTDAGWTYDRSDAALGPGAWAQNFAECAGERNSPIDIDRRETVKRVAEPWKLKGWNKPATWTVTDRNHTIHFGLESEQITSTGGDLDKVYNLLQFHFHWGQTNAKGGEHTLNGGAFPMEIHFVHWDSSQATAQDAIAEGLDDSLAALGFFFRIQPRDNPVLAKIVEGVRQVRLSTNTNQTVKAYGLDALTDLVSPAINGKFFRYFGGLTTPGCQQIVKWTVFETPIGISQAQVDAFRNQASGIHREENYRDPVPLGKRVVTMYQPARGGPRPSPRPRPGPPRRRNRCFRIRNRFRRRRCLSRRRGQQG